MLSGVQLHARTRSARLRESVSIWRALSAVLFPSGISGRPGAAVMVRLLIVRKERDAPGSPARGIDRGETAAQVLSLCPSVCTIRDELPRLYSYSPETPARVCERLRVFCGVPSCRSCREERKPRRQALSRPHCLNPRAPRLPAVPGSVLVTVGTSSGVLSSGRGEPARCRHGLSSPSASAAGGISSAVRGERPALPSPSSQAPESVGCRLCRKGKRLEGLRRCRGI